MNPIINLFRRKTKSQRGFSLVELLIVIAIISVLLAIVYSNLSQSRENAWNKKVRSELQNVQVAMELYKAQHGKYPDPQGNTNDWCSGGPVTITGTTPIAKSNFAVSGEVTPVIESITAFTLGDKFCEKEPIMEDLVPEFISILPGQDESVSEDCSFVYAVTESRDAYKVTAVGCHLGAEDESEGVQPDDDLARCLDTCGTCGIAGPAELRTNDSAEELFYKSYAVYSERAQCY